jgi:hypothetical protein
MAYAVEKNLEPSSTTQSVLGRSVQAEEMRVRVDTSLAHRIWFSNEEEMMKGLREQLERKMLSPERLGLTKALLHDVGL